MRGLTVVVRLMASLRLLWNDQSAHRGERARRVLINVLDSIPHHQVVLAVDQPVEAEQLRGAEAGLLTPRRRCQRCARAAWARSLQEAVSLSSLPWRDINDCVGTTGSPTVIVSGAGIGGLQRCTCAPPGRHRRACARACGAPRGRSRSATACTCGRTRPALCASSGCSAPSRRRARRSSGWSTSRRDAG